MLPTREACVLHVWHKCDVVYKNSCILKRRPHVVSLGFLVGNGAKLDLFSLLLIHDVLLLFWFLSDCFFKMTLFFAYYSDFFLEIIIVYLLFKKAFFLLSFEVTYTQKLIKAFVKPRWQGLSKTTTKSALLCISKESLFKVKLELSNCPISVCGHAALGPIVLSAVFVTFFVTAVLGKYSGFCFACRSLHYCIFESVFTSFRILFPASILKNVSSDYSR